MPEEIHVGDVGTVFEATLVEYDVDLAADVILDISSATVHQLKFQAGDGVTVVVDAIFSTNGEDGKLKYATPAPTPADPPDIPAGPDFLALAGRWQWQPYLELPDWQGHGDVAEFLVYPNL